jgi:hypothetical protein
MRLTTEQLNEILSKNGYTVQGGVGFKPSIATQGSLPIEDSREDAVPVTECGAGNGSLATPEVENGDTKRFLVRVKIFRKRLLDPDNCAYGIKIILDACRYVGSIPEDRPQDIKLEIAEQIKVATDAEERVEVEVYAPKTLAT